MLLLTNFKMSPKMMKNAKAATFLNANKPNETSQKLSTKPDLFTENLKRRKKLEKCQDLEV